MQIGNATELLPPGSDHSPAWYEARAQGVTASEIPVILGLSKWAGPLELFFLKRGELEPEPSSHRQMLGLALEDYISVCFTDATGLELDGAGLLASTERPWQMATPDRLVAGTPVPVELKTALSEDDWGSAGSSEIPVYYRCQLLWQMDVLGAAEGYMCVVFLRTGEPRWYQIGWDGEDIAVMREGALDFMRRVEDCDPPAADALDATTQALRRRYSMDENIPDAVCGPGLKRTYAAAVRARKHADERHKLAVNKIRMAMGTSVRLRDTDGSIVATRRGPKDALYPGKDLT